MLILSITPETIKPFFQDTYYFRGVAYHEEDCVHDVNVAIKENSEIITACVEGSYEKHYRVKVVLSNKSGKLHLQGECACPIGFNCKHIVATLLTVIDEQEFLLDDIEDDKLVKQSKLDFQLEEWLKELKEAVKEKKSNTKRDENYSVHYIFSLPDKDRKNDLYLTVQLIRQLKSGKLGAPKRYNPYSNWHEKHLYPVDKELFVNLEAAARHNDNYFLMDDAFHFEGALFEKYLPELIATNRCHWLQPDAAPITLGEPKILELRWHSDSQGMQELKFHFEENSDFYHVVLVDQPWYIHQKTGQMGLIHSNVNSNLLKILLTAPKISPEAATKVFDVLEESDKFDNVSRPTLRETSRLQTITPDIVLRLFQKNVSTYGYNENRLWTLIKADKPLADLTFDYQGIEVQWNDEKDSVSLVKENEIVPFKRNKKMENKARDILISHGFSPLKNLAGYRQHSENKAFLNSFVLDGAQSDYLNFSFALPQLRAQGWKILIDEDYPYQVVDQPIDDWYSTIEEESSYDWFNLELGIILQGEKINLLPVLKQALTHLQTTQNKIMESSSEPILARLPDGRFLPLPMERVKSILNVLVELYDHNSLSEDNLLRLSKLQAARLLELEAATGATGLRWYGGEKLKKLAEKLTQFKEITPVETPKEFKGQLRSYQAEGVNWLQFLREYEFGGILADDMGLGKTVQTLCHLTVEKAAGRCKKPSLIIAPTTLMFNWSNEVKRFAPHLKTLVLHGSQRKLSFEGMTDYDLIFTTYALLKHDKDNLLQQDFYFLILDEAQSIKNFKSLTAQIAQQIRAEHRLCLTGTPMENHLGELWSLFHFMMPGLLGNEKTFNSLFRHPIEKQNNMERREHLNRRLAPFLLRRTKAEVVKELPEKIHMLQQVELEGEQRDLYETIRVTLQKKIRDEMSQMGFARSQIVILDALLKLRQICCDPRLLKTNSSKKITRSAKLELLMAMLSGLLEEGRRILIFSQFTEMLGLMEAELNQQKIPFVKLTGQTKDRATPVKQFQEGKVSLFLLSLKAGGTGLNLTTADTVIHYDPWWNPAVEDQATDRAHRIGQDKVVFVYKFIAKGTVEEKIMEMQKHKRALMEGIFSETGENHSHFTEEDLQKLFEPI